MASNRRPHPPDTPDQVGVRQALQELPIKQREVIVLRFYLGMTADEAATALDTTAGAVRALTHRGVRRLRELLMLDEQEEARDVPRS